MSDKKLDRTEHIKEICDLLTKGAGKVLLFRKLLITFDKGE